MCAPSNNLNISRLSTIMNRIDAILSLQSELREPVISASILRAIQTVHDTISHSTESQGWRKVDWRGGSSAAGGSGPSRTFNKFRGSAGAVATNTGSSSSSSSSSNSSSSSALPQKYVSRFKKTGEADDAVLLLIQDKLNNFTPKNYKEIFHFLCQILDSGKTHFLKDFMTFVFKKATREETFCPYYAQLLCELTGKYSVLLSEMIARYREFAAIFEDISELETDSYKELLNSNSDKAYRQGYAQFLGELIKYNVLDTDLFVATLDSIVHNIQRMAPNEKGKPVLEEYVICLSRIISSIKEERTELAKSLRTVLKERFASVLAPLTVKDPTFAGISARSRFTTMNIVDIIKAF